MLKNVTTIKAQFKCFGTFLSISLPFLFLAFAFTGNAPVFFSVNLFLGLLSWTYLEYHLHRFWTHTSNGGSKQGAFQRHMHHHKHPTEIKVTPLQRLLLVMICSALLFAAIRWNNSFTIFAGFVIGFSYSFFSHWILHQQWSAKVLPRLHCFHIHHHCKYPDRCFGFSTTLWDIVFKTVPPKEAVMSKRIIQFYYGHQH